MVSFIPGRFALGETAPGTHWIWGLVGPRAGMDSMEKKKISCPFQESIPGRPAYSLVAIPAELLPWYKQTAALNPSLPRQAIWSVDRTLQNRLHPLLTDLSADFRQWIVCFHSMAPSAPPHILFDTFCTPGRFAHTQFLPCMRTQIRVTAQFSLQRILLLGVSSSGIWRRVVRWVSTDVSEEHVASVFTAEEQSM
jgi:hypothetical protein